MMSDSTLSTEQQISSIWDLGGLTLRELARRVWGGINQHDLVNRGYELAFNFLLAVFPFPSLPDRAAWSVRVRGNQTAD